MDAEEKSQFFFLTCAMCPTPQALFVFLGQAKNLNVTETIDCNLKYFSTTLSVTTEKHLSSLHLLTAEFEMSQLPSVSVLF